MLLLALTPVLVPLFLLTVLQMRAGRAMQISFLITASVALLAWKVPVRRVAAAALEGWILAASILWIVLGALVLYNVMRASGAMDSLRIRLAAASPDRRTHVLLIAWMFGAFLESVAGFGTPLAVCAPLLVALGFPAAGAVVLCLLANSAPVMFGAAGTPILIGMTQGLGAAASGELVREAGILAAGLNVAVGSFIPLLMILLYTRYFDSSRSFAWGAAFWKPALLAGFGFTIPAWLAAIFLGPEFPSLLGAVGGFVAMGLAFRLGWLPRGSAPPHHDGMPFFKAVNPYIWLVMLLALTRLVTPLRQAMQDASLSFPGILGTDIKASFAILYSPGTIFLFVSLLAFRYHGLAAPAVRGIAHDVLRKFGPSALTLLAALPLVRIFIHSGENDQGLMAMPLELAAYASGAAGSAWPLFAPFVGALGAFVSGSATFSNLMFSLLQHDAAVATGSPSALVLALQAVGASAGNMLSVLNVVAAAAVVGLSGREGAALRLTVLPTLAFCLLAGMIGLLLSG